LVGFVPFASVVAFGPGLFSFVFGAEWEAAGIYARWLSLWLYCVFVAVPSVQAIPILGLQGHFLVYEVAVTTLRVISLATGALVLRSDVAAIALFSAVGAIVNIAQIAWCILSCDIRTREKM
jgi:hypothetical protein